MTNELNTHELNIDAATAAAILDDALNFNLKNYGWTIPPTAQFGDDDWLATRNTPALNAAIDRIAATADNDGDFRTLLTSFTCMTLKEFLAMILDEYTEDLNTKGPWRGRGKPELLELRQGYLILHYMLNDEHSMMRDKLTQLMIDASLCPLHFCDWASCFDDDDAECSAIRAIYPHSHDT